MANWLAALGDSFLAGSSMIARNRAEQRELDQIAEEKKFRALQMALMEKDQAIQESELGRTRAKDILDLAGPNSILDEVSARTVTEGGMGFRLQPQEATLGSRQFTPGFDGEVEQVESPGFQAGQRVLPTAAEQIALDEAAYQKGERARVRGENERQARYRVVVESPTFLTQPQPKRQAIWTAAGYPGQVPDTFEEQKKLLDYQHRLGMDKARLSATAQRTRASLGQNSEEQLWFANVNRLEDNIRAKYTGGLNAAAQNEDWAKFEAIMQRIDAEIAERLKTLGPKPGTVPKPWELIP